MGTMLQRVAAMVAPLFVTGTRDDGVAYVYRVNEAPQWVAGLCHDAHGDMAPNDWRYQKIRETLDALADGQDEDEARGAVSEPDIYTGELLAWLASHGHRVAYVDDACAERGVDSSAGITDRVQFGQMAEAAEVFDSVLASLRGVIADRLGADPDEDGEDLDDDTIRAGLELARVAP